MEGLTCAGWDGASTGGFVAFQLESIEGFTRADKGDAASDNEDGVGLHSLRR